MADITSSDFSELIGEDLSGVTFVRDYLQLQFNPRPAFSAYTPVTVRHGAESAVFGDRAFANLVLNQIGKFVTRVDLVAEQELLIAFEDGSTISVSLRPEHYVGPEAIYFDGAKSWFVV